MSVLLALDTATPVCSIALYKDSLLFGEQTYHLSHSHSELLPAAIGQLCKNCKIEIKDLDAVAVSSGPGSYTGLRIGTSTAKGLCYALDIPLLAVGTLAALHEQVRTRIPDEAYSCPMIDARRMEVYCQLYGHEGLIWDTRALVIEKETFEAYQDHPIYLYGDGAEKTGAVLNQQNLRWIPRVFPSASSLGRLAMSKLENEDFEDLAYFEPGYLKEFQAKPAKKLV